MKNSDTIIKQFHYKREVKQNPYIGFTTFQHFRDDKLYSDLIVRPENNMTETEHVECYPVPKYVAELGREQGYYPDCSVVYIRILWKEFEPLQGEYNYVFIESILQKARENGQTLMFRLMPHSTRESDDVPDWVKSIIVCPARPRGERVKESPSDPMFLELFGRAIQKLGERFDKDPTFAMLDISLPGSWGEGSSLELFSQKDIEKYLDIYTSVFKNTLLIGQSASPWVVSYGNQTVPVGWRADGVGSMKHMTILYPARIEKLGDIWKKAPVSFESYWWLGEWKRQGWDLDYIIQKTLDWHISHFNAKSLPIPYEWKDKIDAWVSKIGYHFVIRKVETPIKVKKETVLSLKLVIDNVGVAPIYKRLPLYIRLKNLIMEKTFETAVDIRRWIEGEYEENIEIELLNDIVSGEYELQIGIGGHGEPSVVFATDAKQEEDYAVLTNILVEN